MQTGKRLKGREAFSQKIMLCVSPETYARVQREAEATQQTLSGVVRTIVARTFAQEPKHRPAQSADEIRAA